MEVEQLPPDVTLRDYRDLSEDELVQLLIARGFGTDEIARLPYEYDYYTHSRSRMPSLRNLVATERRRTASEGLSESTRPKKRARTGDALVPRLPLDILKHHVLPFIPAFRDVVRLAAAEKGLYAFFREQVWPRRWRQLLKTTSTFAHRLDVYIQIPGAKMSLMRANIILSKRCELCYEDAAGANPAYNAKAQTWGLYAHSRCVAAITGRLRYDDLPRGTALVRRHAWAPIEGIFDPCLALGGNHITGELHGTRTQADVEQELLRDETKRQLEHARSERRKFERFRELVNDDWLRGVMDRHPDFFRRMVPDWRASYSTHATVNEFRRVMRDVEEARAELPCLPLEDLLNMIAENPPRPGSRWHNTRTTAAFLSSAHAVLKGRSARAVQSWVDSVVATIPRALANQRDELTKVFYESQEWKDVREGVRRAMRRGWAPVFVRECQAKLPVLQGEEKALTDIFVRGTCIERNVKRLVWAKQNEGRAPRDALLVLYNKEERDEALQTYERLRTWVDEQGVASVVSPLQLAKDLDAVALLADVRAQVPVEAISSLDLVKRGQRWYGRRGGWYYRDTAYSLIGGHVRNALEMWPHVRVYMPDAPDANLFVQTWDNVDALEKVHRFCEAHKDVPALIDKPLLFTVVKNGWWSDIMKEAAPVAELLRAGKEVPEEAYGDNAMVQRALHALHVEQGTAWAERVRDEFAAVPCDELLEVFLANVHDEKSRDAAAADLNQRHVRARELVRQHPTLDRLEPALVATPATDEEVAAMVETIAWLDSGRPLWREMQGEDLMVLVKAAAARDARTCDEHVYMHLSKCCVCGAPAARCSTWKCGDCCEGEGPEGPCRRHKRKKREEEEE